MKINNTDLIECVDQKISNVRTKSLDLSFNELLDMYKDGELIISPEYQRFFRWSEEQQARFIESLILELPIPPIFVIEKEQNIYELIDGLQRISTYLHFRGIHDERKNKNGEHSFLILKGCDIVKELNGFTYETLPQALKIKLKRNFVRVEIIKKGSDERLCYYMFKRLNTGGSSLSSQEIRNCTVHLLGNKFVDFIVKMNKYQAFRNCITPIMDYEIERKYDEELVLRFFAFKNNINKYQHGYERATFLTEYMEDVSDEKTPFDYDLEENIFTKTFGILSSVLGKEIFINMKNQFLSFHFEAFSLGIQKLIAIIDISDKGQISKIREVLKRLKQDDDFKEVSKSRLSKEQIKKRIKSVEKAIESVL